ncbi:hypothetical protein [Leucobacter sp. W1478]|uniref:hypothetical protein n=1 Tax=Leucobacter sp. W1478 TaxID=3439065 RepID=UPI003F2DB56A
MSEENSAQTANYKAWFKWLIVSVALGLLLGFLLRGLFPGWVATIVGLIGYVSAIVAIGTGNVFQGDDAKHFSETTQRWIGLVSGVALGASAVTIFS